jgi:hypothetical protein
LEVALDIGPVAEEAHLRDACACGDRFVLPDVPAAEDPEAQPAATESSGLGERLDRNVLFPVASDEERDRPALAAPSARRSASRAAVSGRKRSVSIG